MASLGPPDPRQSAPGAEPFVGRESELRTLTALLSDARAGVGGAVLIEGAAGMGKSRLVAEVLARSRADGMQVLGARAIEAERDVAFGIALQLFDAAVAGADAPARDALFDGAAGLAAPLFRGGAGDPTAASSFPLVHGLFWLSVNLAQLAPVVVCVDDLHWSDESSRGFLRYLANRVDALPIAVVLARRPEPADPRPALRPGGGGVWGVPRRLRIGPLAQDAIAELVRARLPDADPEFCAACAEVSGGNPFYVREILLAVSEEGLSPTAEFSGRLREVGFASISRAALFRLARLGPDAIALAQALSVLGEGAPLRRAAVLAGLEFQRAAQAAGALADEELVRRDVTLEFAHPLIGQLVYNEMPPMKAALAHAEAAKLLAAESAPPETIAGHLLGAPPAGDGWVVDILRRRARSAQARNAPQIAARYLARALDEPPPRQIRGEVLAELGAAEAAAGIDAAVEHLRESVEFTAGPRERARVRGLLGRTLAGLGRHGEAAEALEIALDALSPEDPQLRSLLVDYLANATFESGLRQQAFARAADLLGEVPSGDTPADRALLAPMAMRSGQDAAAAEYTLDLADRAWSGGQLLVDQGADGSGWMMAAWAVELAGDHGRAERITTAVIEVARSAGSVEAFAAASYFRAWTRWRLGRLVDAQADVEQAIEAGGAPRRRYRLAALAVKADVLVDRGQLDAAQQAVALADDYDSGTAMEVAWRMHAHGRLELARGHAAEALQFSTSAGEWLAQRLGVEHTVLPWRTDAAQAALALGQVDVARDLGESALALARRTGSPAHLGRALAILGRVDDGATAIETLREACAQLALGGEALDRARALIDLGSALRRRGSRAEARRPLTEALDVTTRLGAPMVARRARDELAASGGRPRTELRSGPDALTPSERRVAELAVGGRTNAEIAQALFVTPKTVEYHLRHVYQKLGITGRARIAAALAAEPTEPPPTE